MRKSQTELMRWMPDAAVAVVVAVTVVVVAADAEAAAVAVPVYVGTVLGGGCFEK